MIYIILTVLGLALGSFVNALVCRTHMSTRANHPLSVWKGRSMCTHCNTALRWIDLLPVFSWLSLKGKCRYCHEKIDDTPFAELLVPFLFLISYSFWPFGFEQLMPIVLFVVWLMILTVFAAMLIYDIRWMILPDKFTLVFSALAVMAVLLQFVYNGSLTTLFASILSAVLVGGLFYLLHLVSQGAWIGGGDVKLGFGLGLLAGTPLAGFLLVFLASILGTLVALPGLISKRLTYHDKLPFGPFLIIATIFVFLVGERLIHWYTQTLIFGI